MTYDRTIHPARGFHGGLDGATGELFLQEGGALHPKSKYLLQPGESVTLRLPGGGGYGPAWQREPHRVLEDVRQELVSVEAARNLYGVVIDTETWTVDEAGTAALRSVGLTAGPRSGRELV